MMWLLTVALSGGYKLVNDASQVTLQKEMFGSLDSISDTQMAAMVSERKNSANAGHGYWWVWADGQNLRARDSEGRVETGG